MAASAAAAHGHDRVAVYKAVPVAMAAALTEGLSIEASLDGLSLGADPHTHTHQCCHVAFQHY